MVLPAHDSPKGEDGGRPTILRGFLELGVPYYSKGQSLTHLLLARKGCTSSVPLRANNIRKGPTAYSWSSRKGDAGH